MKHLAKLKWVLFTAKLKVATDKYEKAAVSSRGLEVNGGDMVQALRKREVHQLLFDVLDALNLHALECQHGLIPVEIG
ncbi:unnamed protein product [Cuscuta europaea]|uniref:Uncharacterized protein n=1 Tax=Cuscuta europaea TaxID=41803 RepID=A0A9P1DYM9_CUSEU|nr:unnamed protein product [Cuscuta europaea]